MCMYIYIHVHILYKCIHIYTYYAYIYIHIAIQRPRTTPQIHTSCCCVNQIFSPPPSPPCARPRFQKARFHWYAVGISFIQSLQVRAVDAGFVHTTTVHHEDQTPRVKWETPTNKILSRMRTFSAGPFRSTVHFVFLACPILSDVSYAFICTYLHRYMNPKP